MKKLIAPVSFLFLAFAFLTFTVLFPSCSQPINFDPPSSTIAVQNLTYGSVFYVPDSASKDLSPTNTPKHKHVKGWKSKSAKFLVFADDAAILAATIPADTIGILNASTGLVTPMLSSTVSVEAILDDNSMATGTLDMIPINIAGSWTNPDSPNPMVTTLFLNTSSLNSGYFCIDDPTVHYNWSAVDGNLYLDMPGMAIMATFSPTSDTTMILDATGTSSTANIITIYKQ